MNAIRKLLTGFFVGLFFTAAILVGIYFDQKFGAQIEELPIVKELTDTYLLGWEQIKEIGIGLLPDSLSSIQKNISISEQTAPLQITWKRSSIVAKLQQEGFEGGKMKSALHYIDYIDQYQDLAIANQQAYGILASVQLAQALLESNAGRSKLALNTNNHFGIKARLSQQAHRKIQARRHELLTDKDFIISDPAISVFNMHDDYAHDRFETYSTVEDSYLRHTQLLTRPCTAGRVGCYNWIWKTYKVGNAYNLSDKANLYYKRTQLRGVDFFDGRANVPYFAAAAAGLKMAGYATSKTYHKKLAYIIETYELWRFDMAQPINI